MPVETRLTILRSPHNNRTPSVGRFDNITRPDMAPSDGSKFEPDIPLNEFVVRAKRALRARVLGRRIVAVPEVDSTNRLAREGVRNGDSAGTVYITDHQTQGRGRMGRTWSAEKGQNLLFSVIIETTGPILTHIPLRAALAVRDAVDVAVPQKPVEVKWPNDVLITGKKCAGMLLEAASSGQSRLVLGIGVNVNQLSFPPDHRDTATSLRLESGEVVDRVSLFCGILESLEQRLINSQPATTRWMADYEDVMYRRAQDITLYFPERKSSISGTIRGIAEDGALLLESPELGCQAYYAGDVTTRIPEA